MKSCIIFSFTIACIFKSFGRSDTQNANMKLELVQVLFRHGARTPDKEEARIININDPTIYGPDGFGELTNEGKEQSHRLGSLLRREYNEFLGDYNSEEYYAYTSLSSRTKMTLQLVLAGLYPPSDKDKSNSILDWRSVPFEEATDLCDALVTPHKCKKYSEVFTKVIFESKDFSNKISKYDDLIDHLANITGVSYRDKLLNNCGWTYYAINIHKMMNLPLPSWCTDEVYNSLRDMYIITLESMSGTPEVSKINGGTLVGRMLENIKSNENATMPKKIYLYSAHDLTIAGLTEAQKIKAFDIPPFGSAVILEKFKDDHGEDYVRMRSWDGSSDHFKTLRIGHFEEYCPLEDYKQMVKDVLPTDEEINFLTS